MPADKRPKELALHVSTCHMPPIVEGGDIRIRTVITTNRGRVMEFVSITTNGTTKNVWRVMPDLTPENIIQ